MAGTSESGEVDFWPGYVDALTAMVKVLTFVMMLLALAIYAISQKVSKQTLNDVAKAAGVEVNSNAKMNDIAKEVMAKLADVRSAEQSNQAVLKAVQKTAGEAGVAIPESANLEATLTALKNALEAKRKDGEQPPAAPPASAAQAVPTTQPTPAPAASSPIEARLEVKDAPKPAEANASTSAAIDGLDFTIRFRGNGVKLDAETEAALKAHISSSALPPGSRIVVSAYADVQSGAMSEGRKLAFYRAMGVRQSIMAAGIEAARIDIAVKDSKNTDDAHLVRIGRKGQ